MRHAERLRRHSRHADVARHAHPQARLLDFDLRQAGLLEDSGKVTNEARLEGIV